MNYKTFDRHANMTEQTLDQISSLIREMMLEDAPGTLINQTYGLYDGYYYNLLGERVIAFFKPINPKACDLARQIFRQVVEYNFYSPYGDESPEEIARMMAQVN